VVIHAAARWIEIRVRYDCVFARPDVSAQTVVLRHEPVSSLYEHLSRCRVHRGPLILWCKEAPVVPTIRILRWRGRTGMRGPA
jgi:hypothetical protein